MTHQVIAYTNQHLPFIIIFNFLCMMSKRSGVQLQKDRWVLFYYQHIIYSFISLRSQQYFSEFFVLSLAEAGTDRIHENNKT